MGEGLPIDVAAEWGSASAVTRTKSVAFQGQIEERLVELLSLKRARARNADDTTLPGQRSVAPAAAQAL